jgi:hypothetical protein
MGFDVTGTQFSPLKHAHHFLGEPPIYESLRWKPRS